MIEEIKGAALNAAFFCYEHQTAVFAVSVVGVVLVAVSLPSLIRARRVLKVSQVEAAEARFERGLAEVAR